jgi:hypothetical protein
VAPVNPEASSYVGELDAILKAKASEADLAGKLANDVAKVLTQITPAYQDAILTR